MASYEANTRTAVWKEEFTFHVPNSAVSVKAAFFDEKQAEDDGYMGSIEIIFDQMESRADFKTIVADNDTTKEAVKEAPAEASTRVGRVLQRLYSSIVSDDANAESTRNPNKSYSVSSADNKTDNSGRDQGDEKEAPPSETSAHSEGAVPGKTVPSTSHVSFTPDPDELASFSKDSDDEESDADGCKPSSPSKDPDVFMYTLTEEVKNKSGKVHGNAEVKVTIKGASSTDYSKGNKAKMFARNKQLSTTPTEAVAETFCHLLTLPWNKLTEMRNFYDPDAKYQCTNAPLPPVVSRCESDPNAESSSVEELQEAFKLPSKRRASKMNHRSGSRNSMAAVSPILSDIAERDSESARPDDFEGDETKSMSTTGKIGKKDSEVVVSAEITEKDCRKDSVTDVDSVFDNESGKGSGVRLV